MAAKRLAVLFVLVLLPASAWAQINDVALTVGRTFISTQTVRSTGLPVHFGNEETVQFNYGRVLWARGLFNITAELPVAIAPRADVNYYFGTTPKDIGSIFVTPSARVNIFPTASVTPWVSLGGGYGHFRAASTTLYNGANPGSGSNTAVLQIGVGLDVWPWERWGARVEARDFYSGVPNLNVETNRGRQHNFYVGVGVIHRF